MKVSVIISYYKNQKNLLLLLKALNNQTASNFEVIISEDDYNQDTISFLSGIKSKMSYPLLHTHQHEDLGFRKTMMLNKSIRKSSGDFLIFIDGDCVPNSKFVEQYSKNAEVGYMLLGRRVMLSKQLSERALKEQNPKVFTLKNILLSTSKKKKEAFFTAPFSMVATLNNKGLLGCNWGIYKKHLLDINGFDEDYVHAAVGEDTDVEWRLRKIGIQPKSVKNKAIVYHLYHERGYSQEGVKINRELLQKKIEANNYKCLNGLKKI